jgi:signal transduction histidine kinase/ActR/RegA family two-component response regulator
VKKANRKSATGQSAGEDDSSLQRWRETALFRLGLVILLVGVPAAAFVGWHHVQAGRVGIAIADLALCIPLAVLLPIRRLSYRLRAVVCVAVFVLGGILNYAMAGLASGGAVVFAGAALLAALLLGSRWGFAALALTTLCLAGAGVLFTQGALPFPSTAILDPRLGSNWLRATIFYAAIAGTVLAAAVFLVGKFETNLHRSAELVDSLRREVTVREQAEDHLRDAQKMEAIGTLAGGIAHDFNNILSGVLGYAELARQEAEGNVELENDLDEVLRAAHRAKDLVARILAFSRQREEERRPLRVQHVLKEALGLLRASIPTSIEIHQRIDEDCGPVLGDTAQLHQVVMNLCTNAFLAMRELDSGVLDVALRELELDAASAASSSDLEPGRYAELRISDTGCGMDHATQARIFEPYFTTRPKGEGTGLGLATVHSIVRSCGGAILLSSEPGQGTTFRVLFPLCDRQASLMPAKDFGPVPTGTERILFVDDEASIAEFGRNALERLGYRVTACTSATDAWRTFESDPDRFDVLVTDVSMPTLTGVELARNLRQIRPALRIIACTGFSEVAMERRLRDAGVAKLVMKPVLIRDLACAIRDVLDVRDAGTESTAASSTAAV